MNIIPVLAGILKNVANRNKEDIEVKTADPVVFEELKKKFEKVESVETETREESIYDILNKRVDEARVENEANPEVETADSSVYDTIMKEIEKYRNSGGTPASEPQATQGYEPPSSSGIMQAMTNSSGGSLQIRQSPDMGAPVHQTVRIPDSSLISVLQYSDNKIILDGRESRFALIEYNGVRGWVLENYLNFN